MATLYEIIKSAENLYETNVLADKEIIAPERVLNNLLNSEQYKDNYAVQRMRKGEKLEEIADELIAERKKIFFF